MPSLTDLLIYFFNREKYSFQAELEELEPATKPSPTYTDTAEKAINDAEIFDRITCL